MLIARAMQDGRYEDAQHLLDTIHQPQIDKEERQAILLMRQGRDEEAARRWERVSSGFLPISWAPSTALSR